MAHHRPLPTQPVLPAGNRVAFRPFVATPDHREPAFGGVVPLHAAGRSRGTVVPGDGSAAPSTAASPIAADLFRPLGLLENPFSPAQVPDEAILPEISDGAATLASWAGSDRADGTLAVVTGPARSGRTTLIRMALRPLADDPRVRVVPVPLSDAQRTANRFLQAIIRATGETPQGRNSLDLVRQMQRHAAHASHPLVLVLDGAIAFDGPQLDVLRSLLIGGTSLRIIATGTPELIERIQRRRSLSERLSHRQGIAPLAPDTLGDYLQQRIARVANPAETLPVSSFTPEAVAIIATWSDGVVGPAVEVARECLLEAIARGTRRVDGSIAHDVTREFVDRARLAARQRADSPYMVPAIQAVLDLASVATATTSSPLSRTEGHRR